MNEAVVYDSGALIAIADQRKRRAWDGHRRRVAGGLRIIVPAVVAAQVVRKPATQERLMRTLRGCDVVPFTAAHHVPVGELLAVSGTADVVDAFVALVAVGCGAGIVSGDSRDLARLLGCLGARLPVLSV